MLYNYYYYYHYYYYIVSYSYYTKYFMINTCVTITAITDCRIVDLSWRATEYPPAIAALWGPRPSKARLHQY